MTGGGPDDPPFLPAPSLVHHVDRITHLDRVKSASRCLACMEQTARLGRAPCVAGRSHFTSEREVQLSGGVTTGCRGDARHQDALTTYAGWLWAC